MTREGHDGARTVLGRDEIELAAQLITGKRFNNGAAAARDELNGTFEFISNEHGTRAIVTFPRTHTGPTSKR